MSDQTPKTAPKVEAETITIRSGGVHEDGTKAEPEEQVVENRIVTSATEVTKGGQALDAAFPVHIVTEATAGEVAKKLAAPCGKCKFWDNRWWMKQLKTADPLNPLNNHTLNEIRAALIGCSSVDINLLHIGKDGDLDADHAMGSLGLCRALTELQKEEVLVHSSGSCPKEYCSPEIPHGLWEPRDRDAEKHQANVYDEVLHRAQGKTP